MPVMVKVGGALGKLIGGQPQSEAEGATVGELLDDLNLRKELCDKRGKLRAYLIISVNGGKDVRLLQGLATPVKEGDTVGIFYAIGGG